MFQRCGTTAARANRAITVLALISGLLFASHVTAQDAAPAPVNVPAETGAELFEKRIRPVLAQHCFRCHGPDRQRGSLRLDYYAAIMRGGDRGPALVAGNLKESLLIAAIGYTDPDFQMPPSGKLDDATIGLLTAWVEQGAPGPAMPDDVPDEATKPASNEGSFNFEERRQHWAYQPVRAFEPPEVCADTWAITAVDRFVLRKLEDAGLSPAAAADKRTLIRRMTFDLTGLPPTPDEISAFLADEGPDAVPRLVDRLLASPHYGERWARHWLDLVRYADTLGHEFDYDLFNAWRYRDYVIRAFNADVPYNQFVVEHLAGDLLASPRRNPQDGSNESIIGTGFYWLGEAKHSPVDARQEQAERIDNQIDVLGKLLLAQTIGCARCHDHKFDAIRSRDYYSLAGYLKSSRYQQAAIDSPERIAAKAEQLAELKRQMRACLAEELLPVWQAELACVAEYLLASRQVLLQKAATNTGEAASESLQSETERIASAAGLDPAVLIRWVTAVEGANSWRHPLFVWNRLARGVDVAPSEFQAGRDALAAEGAQLAARVTALTHEKYACLADFSKGDFSGWSATTNAFVPSSEPADFTLRSIQVQPPLRVLPQGLAHSGRLSARLEGELRSPTFTIESRYLHLFLVGHGARVNIVVDGFTLIRDPIYGPLTFAVDDKELTWHTVDLEMWRGRRAYIELMDCSTPNLTSPAPNPQPQEAWIGCAAVYTSNEAAAPPMVPIELHARALSDSRSATLEGLAETIQDELVRAVSWALDPASAGNSANDDEQAGLVDWLLTAGLVSSTVETNGPFEGLVSAYRAIEESIPAPTRVPAMVDGTGEDEFVFLRGNYKTPGEIAPRRPLEALGLEQPELPPGSSGRLQLAQALIDPKNPLLARVLVNRVWQHHFGVGLVASPDDFGRMGEKPSHPELLDYLADWFVRDGWSIKRLHRLLLTSATYQMASHADAEAERIDPQNRLLHRMPVRRLEAEVVRDAMLATAGRLDSTMFGPGVMPHLTEYMEGTGRPGASGPLDGGGRRSIYISVRRNFLTPMLQVFDFPTPFTTIGRRNASNVPAQALALLNDPLVTELAKRWGEQALAGSPCAAELRVERLYETAFGRSPTAAEAEESARFITEQANRYGVDMADSRPWADLCHVLLNTKQFLFVE